MIESFRGPHRFLSNFFIEPDGTCVEAEYQAAKTPLLGEKVQILGQSPRVAKVQGRHVTLRHDWELVKKEVMREYVLRKFFDHPELREQLLATGDQELVEGNTWHDNIWGMCTCFNCSTTASPQNALGNILMEVRAVFQPVELPLVDEVRT